MKSLKQRVISLAVALSISAIGIALVPATASAQITTFMQVPGIAGSSTDAKHPGWISVVSLVQSMSSKTRTAASAGASAPATVCGEIEIVKGLDNAGPNLWGAILSGRPFDRITIEVMVPRPNGDTMKIYEIRLSNVAFTSITTTQNSSAFAETVTLKAQTVQLTSFGLNANGTPAMPVSNTLQCAMY